MFQIIIAGIKIIAFMMFVAATYKSAQYYTNKSDDYETALERDISRKDRRERAVEHFENLENRN